MKFSKEERNLIYGNNRDSNCNHNINSFIRYSRSLWNRSFFYCAIRTGVQHQKNKQILEELKTIREKFGLLREDEKIQIEIDKSIEEYNIAKGDPQKISELDKEIEEELEKYIINNKDMEDKNNKEDKKE